MIIKIPELIFIGSAFNLQKFRCTYQTTMIKRCNLYEIGLRDFLMKCIEQIARDFIAQKRYCSKLRDIKA